MVQIRRIFLPLVLMAVFFCSWFAVAQRPEPRIKGVITAENRTLLAGSGSPRALQEQDAGAVPRGMAVSGITLVFRRSAAQEDALQTLLAAQQNSASPLFHHWLTPESFSARFGMADADVDAAESWLESYGFHIESVARSRDRITFSGSAAQVQAAFGAKLHYYRADGGLHFAPESDLSLPAELASVTSAVLHLSDFRPKPNVRVRTDAHPEFTAISTQAHYLIPEDILTMYDLHSFIERGLAGGGQGLAVVGQSYINTSNPSVISTFSAILTGAAPVSAVLVPGSGPEAISPGDEGESELDLEYASGIAANANIFFVYVGANQNYDAFDALAFAITEDIAPVVSISYGLCESQVSPAAMDAGNALFEEAAAQGQTLVAAAGDAGSTACARYEGVSASQQQALSVLYPADSPYVTAVGGTQMAPGTFAAGDSAYWASATAVDVSHSLLSYVPEVVWNEDSTLNSLWAGGGGASGHFARPAWQSGVGGIPAGAYRLVPDIALQSSIESPGFLVCTDDPFLMGGQGQTSSCASGLEGSNGKYTVSGGTSFAAPVFAGFIAILNQVEHATGQGNINPLLYGMASNSTSYAAVFHDIMSGTNACAAGIAGCSAPGDSEYAATPGYDEATGLGSVDFGQLVKAWPSTSAANLVGTSVLIESSESSAAAGDAVSMEIYVGSLYSGSVVPAPTGAVSVSVDGTVVQPALAFTSTNTMDSNASVNFNVVAPAGAGSHVITVAYAGDASHAPSVATDALLVGNVRASGGFSLAAGDLTVANGSMGSTEITVSPTGGYSGRIVWSVTASTTSTGAPALCYVIGSPAVNGTSTTPMQLGLGSACSGATTRLRPLRAGAFKAENPSRGGKVPGIAVYAGLLFCGALAGRRRRTRRLVVLAVALGGMACAVLSGCGGSQGTSTPPVSATRFTVTLTGTDSVNGAIRASTTFTLTVG